MGYLCLAVLLISSICSAQTSQPPATPQEMLYLRFMLLNVASIDHHPDAIKAYEDSLVKLHGLSAQESLAIHSAGQALHSILAQHRQSLRAIQAKTTPSADDAAYLANLDAEREQAIVNLANQILNSVGAQTAARLRAAGRILGNAVKRN